MDGRYFGDTRDLFTFDLVRHIMKSLPELAGFTFVPMLTGTETAGHGKKDAQKDLDKAYRFGKAGSQNSELREHLMRLQEIANEPEYFRGIGTYFDKEMILIDISGRQRFTNPDRDTYFQSVLHDFPKNSLIFLDPETGLEEEHPDEKHLLLSEVKKVCDHLDSGSILMIYQHIPRAKHEEYVRRRCTQLEESTGSWPAVITDNEIAFFLFAKNQKLMVHLKNALECYADTYPALRFLNCRS